MPSTLTGSRAVKGFPVGGFGGGADLKVAWGSVTLAANPDPADVIEFCWLPKNAVVLGGWVQAGDIDTATDTDNEAFDFDLGWAANGSEAEDPDGFGNLGIWHGDAKTDFRPEEGNFYWLGGVLLTTGPQKFTAATKIIGTINAAATTTGTGIITVVVLYVVAE